MRRTGGANGPVPGEGAPGKEAPGEAELAGALERLVSRVADPWSLEFPGLPSLPAGRSDGSEGVTAVATPGRPLRFLIATEDIAGPSRNGGVGTTYAALATHLAGLGFDTTILYLHGGGVENETLDGWIEDYAARGISLVAVPDYATRDRFRPATGRWLRMPYNLMRFLVDNPVDVVHASEWRGAAYLALMAKRQGLAFQRTLFLIKASSPLLWQRQYALETLNDCDELTQVHGERCCVEWADAVIGGSRHLLRWMAEQGYRLPQGRTFVQPNIVDTGPLETLAKEAGRKPGTRVPVDEIAFFGRLEGRKGLVEFCQAISRLLRQGRRLPRRISFIGKPGDPLPCRLDIDVGTYISEVSKGWPAEVVRHGTFQQADALAYLSRPGVLAVMPSIIENSSLALYEALACAIPFIASDTGGNPELVAPADRAHVLCPPHPVALAAKLGEALRLGAYVARPAFDMSVCLDQWARFHRELAHGLADRLNQGRKIASAEEVGPIAVCIYAVDDGEGLQASLRSLASQTLPPAEVLIGLDAPQLEAWRYTEAMAREVYPSCTVIDVTDLGPGAAFNKLVGTAQSPLALIMWAGARLHAEALGALGQVQARSRADLVTCFCRVVAGAGASGGTHVAVPLPGSGAQALYCREPTPAPALIRADALKDSGGFCEARRTTGAAAELMLRWQLLGAAHVCEMAPMELASMPAADAGWMARRGLEPGASRMQPIQPLLAAAPLAAHSILLMAKSLQSKLELDVEDRQTDAGDVAQEPVGPLGLIDAPLPLADPMLPSAERYWRQANALATAPDSPYSGRILGSLDGVLHGWVRDERDPSRAVELESVIGSGPPAHIIADANPLTALPPAARTRGHAFAIRVHGRWSRRTLTRVLLRIAGSGIVLAEVDVASPRCRLADAGLEGYCDIVDASAIRGWLWSPAQPARVFDVAVFADGKFLARAAASQHRADLQRAGIGNGEHAFTVPLPQAFRSGAIHRLDVVAADSGLHLKRGRLRLRGNVLTAI